MIERLMKQIQNFQGKYQADYYLNTCMYISIHNKFWI